MTKEERRVVRAAMKFFRRYENFYYERGRRNEPGYQLIRACAALQKRKKGMG